MRFGRINPGAEINHGRRYAFGGTVIRNGDSTASSSFLSVSFAYVPDVTKQFNRSLTGVSTIIFISVTTFDGQSVAGAWDNPPPFTLNAGTTYLVTFSVMTWGNNLLFTMG